MKIEFYDDEDTPRVGFYKHCRGQLPICHSTRTSMLYQEVTLEEYLAVQYPAILLERYPEQAVRDREIERSQINSAMSPGDTLWLWTSYGGAGVAVKRGNKIARSWLVWATQDDFEFLSRCNSGEEGKTL